MARKLQEGLRPQAPTLVGAGAAPFAAEDEFECVMQKQQISRGKTEENPRACSCSTVCWP